MGPSTRAAFSALRATYSKTEHFVQDCYSEESLQLELRILVDSTKDLRCEYAAELKSLEGGQFAQLRFTAERCHGGLWFHAVKGLVRRAFSAETADRLGLSPHVPGKQVCRNTDWVQREIKILTKASNMYNNTAANRCTSQSMYVYMFPYLLGGIYHPTEQNRKNTMKLAKAMCAAILKLEDLLLKPGSPKILSELAGDIGTNEWPTVRILWIKGTLCNWDHENSELLGMCFSMNAGPPSSKPLLENLIGWVKDKCARGSKKTGYASNWTKYAYSLTCPYAVSGGVPQIRPDTADFMECKAEVDSVDIKALHPFNPSYAHMGKDFPTVKDIGKFRVAGRMANKVSAAAHAYALDHARKDFSNASHVWQGYRMGLFKPPELCNLASVIGLRGHPGSLGS